MPRAASPAAEVPSHALELEFEGGLWLGPSNAYAANRAHVSSGRRFLDPGAQRGQQAVVLPLLLAQRAVAPQAA